MITVSELNTRLDVKRRDTTSGNIGTNDKISAVNATIDQLRAEVDISTAVERKYFYYLAGETDYSIYNSLGLTDFSNVKDIRIANQPDQMPWERVSGNDFSDLQGQKNAFAVEGIGADLTLKISYVGTAGKVTVHNASNITANGTWSANTSSSDAASIATDTVEYVKYQGSIKFNVTVAQSGNNYAEISVSDMSAINLSGDAYYRRARIRMNVFIPTGGTTNLTSLTFYIGSSASAYYAITVTAPVTGGSFVADAWNRVEFSLPDATITGTPADATLNYLKFRVTYGAGYTNQTGFRINDIVAYEPLRLEMPYYSNYWVDGGTGTARQEKVTTLSGAERITVPGEYLELFADGATADIFHQQGAATANEYKTFQDRFIKAAPTLFKAVGVPKLRKGDVKAKPRSPWPTW